MKPFLIFFLAAVSATLSGCGGHAAEALPVLGKAPDWKLKDLKGNDVSFSDFKGKVVVVDFWATWCPPCREEIPDYIALQKKYANKGLVIVGISVDEQGVDAVAPFAKQMGVNYPIVLFNDDVVAAFGGIDGIPATFLIDRDGNIRNKQVGYVAPGDYERRVLKLLE